MTHNCPGKNLFLGRSEVLRRTAVGCHNIETMKFKIAFSFLLSFHGLVGHSQTNDETLLLDTALAKKITVSGFCLCQTTLPDLQKLSTSFKPIEVEEMDLGNKCVTQDSRFDNGKGY